MGLLDFFGGGNRSQIRSSAHLANDTVIPLQRAADLLSSFPIGARIQYFPEYQRSIKHDTIILGCQVEKHFVFSSGGIKICGAGLTPTLELQTKKSSITLKHLTLLRFIIAQRKRSELDYPSGGPRNPPGRLLEKTVNDFQRGNTITLFNKATDGKVPHVDTTVVRAALLDRGYYRNREVAFLEPDVSTFRMEEQRHYRRGHTSVPALLCETQDGDPFGCWVTDFSERHVRLVIDKAVVVPVPQVGQRFFITLPVDASTKRFHLRGTVQRVDREGMVLALNAILKGNRLKNFDLIDQLEMKATLIHHPATQEHKPTPQSPP